LLAVGLNLQAAFVLTRLLRRMDQLAVPSVVEVATELRAGRQAWPVVELVVAVVVLSGRWQRRLAAAVVDVSTASVPVRCVVLAGRLAWLAAILILTPRWPVRLVVTWVVVATVRVSGSTVLMPFVCVSLAAFSSQRYFSESFR
jgi:hypothetical protein